jgi:thiamine biosynthesis lipoprotein
VKPFWVSTFLLLALVLSSAAIPAVVGPPTLHRYEASRMSMASAYAIVAYGADAGALPAILEAGFDEVDRIDRLMSHYKPESPLSRVNREAAAGPVAVDAELFDFLAESLRYARESEGAFDITVGPLMKTWGFFRGGGRLPTEAEIEDVRARVGYAHVILDANARTVRFDRPGVELDLGGIAKGYAVDRVVELLRRAGVAAALVSAGGSTIYGLGAPPGQEAWDVTIQDPTGGERTALTVRLRDRALSVSGSSEKSFERGGVRYSHIMDPRRGRPAQGVLSVAVLAPTGTAGDALDNVFFVQGVDGSRRLLRHWPDTEVIFFLPGKKEGWKTLRLRGDRAHFSAGRSTAP